MKTGLLALLLLSGAAYATEKTDHYGESVFNKTHMDVPFEATMIKKASPKELAALQVFYKTNYSPPPQRIDGDGTPVFAVVPTDISGSHRPIPYRLKTLD